MKVRRFRAATAGEALAKVRAEWGSDAMIVDTRRVRREGWRGWFRPAEVEVLVATEADQSLSEPLLAELRTIQHSIQTLSTKVATLDAASGGLAHPWVDRLSAAGLSQEVAWSVIGEQPLSDDDERAQTTVRRALASKLRQGSPVIAAPGQVVALVGATGVGKTTTLAKLAARFALVHGLSVGLISADTYRVAAVEQLRTFAQILGVPLKIAATPKEVPTALAELGPVDIIFVDTAGLSPKQTFELRELKNYLAALRPTETHLVISLTTNWEDAKHIAEVFEPIGYDKLLVTKLDEAHSAALAFNLAQELDKPFSYVTSGQRVPEDLNELEPDLLTATVLEVASHA